MDGSLKKLIAKKKMLTVLTCAGNIYLLAIKLTLAQFDIGQPTSQAAATQIRNTPKLVTDSLQVCCTECLFCFNPQQKLNTTQYTVIGI